jgi:gliding motility-associated protein GldC
MPRETEIKFKVTLDDKNMPMSIKWSATDGPQQEDQDSKTMMIALWDGQEKNTMSIDLWTKDMQIDEMHTHFFQRLLSMADTYFKATGNPFVINEMRAFCEELGEKTHVWEERGRK